MCQDDDNDRRWPYVNAYEGWGEGCNKGTNRVDPRQIRPGGLSTGQTASEGGPPMPFSETCRMEERIRMLTEYDTGNWSVLDLCRRYGICRDTFYEWRERRASGAQDWFIERSHAPLHCPHATGAELRDKIISLRRRFRYLGPRKLLAKLERECPEGSWPAASTIGDILKGANLIEPAKRRRRPVDQQ